MSSLNDAALLLTAESTLFCNFAFFLNQLDLKSGRNVGTYLPDFD
jgi:hypothetical protein